MYQSKMHVWRQIALNVSRMVYFWWKTSLVLQTQQVCCTQHQSCVNFACNMMKFGSKLTKISSENNKLDVFSLTMTVSNNWFRTAFCKSGQIFQCHNSDLHLVHAKDGKWDCTLDVQHRLFKWYDQGEKDIFQAMGSEELLFHSTNRKNKLLCCFVVLFCCVVYLLFVAMRVFWK